MIATDHGLSRKFLAQVLVSLRNAGIVDTHRGSDGGYGLARRPDEIRIIEVFDALSPGLDRDRPRVERKPGRRRHRTLRGTRSATRSRDALARLDARRPRCPAGPGDPTERDRRSEQEVVPGVGSHLLLRSSAACDRTRGRAIWAGWRSHIALGRCERPGHGDARCTRRRLVQCHLGVPVTDAASYSLNSICQVGFPTFTVGVVDSRKSTSTSAKRSGCSQCG